MSGFIQGVLKTGSGVIVNLLVSVLSVKVMAVMLGPSGTGIFSLLRQAVTTLTALGGGGLTALVQGIASRRDHDRAQFIRSSFWLFAIAALLVASLTLSFAGPISNWVFGNAEPHNISLIRWLALPVVLFHVALYLKGVLNGWRAIGRLAVVDTLGPIVILMLVVPACRAFQSGNTRAFIWLLALSQVAIALAAWFVIRRNGWMPRIFPLTLPLIDRDSWRYFRSLAGTTFLTGLIGTTVILLVRALVARHEGTFELGLFDLAWTVSGAYVMLILASFGTWYTPTLAQAQTPADRVQVIRQVLRLSTLLMIPLIITTIAIKPLLVTLLYSSEYLDALDLLRWLLIGDYLKVTTWALAIPMIVRHDMKRYFWSEAIWCLGLALATVISLDRFSSLQGIGLGFILLYGAIALYYLVYVCREYGLALDRELVLPWLSGFALVLACSIQTWHDRSTTWMAVLWICLGFGLSAVLTSKKERDGMRAWWGTRFAR